MNDLNKIDRGATKRITMPDGAQYDVRPDVMRVEDVIGMVPKLKGHEKLVERVLHAIWIDRVNDVHARWSDTPGAEFSHHLIEDEFKIDLRVDNEEVLAQFPTGAFATVSNHPFGGFDGIALIHLVSKYRPDYKVMVNMFLNHLSAMRPSFIAVDALASDDPAKKAVSMQGIREAMLRVREGHPVGFFPAGAVSKINGKLRISDREWQPNIIRLIKQLRVPVIPIYFHGSNSTLFNILGLIDWRLRTLRLPYEVFRRRNGKIHVSVGDPISPQRQAQCPDLQALGQLLRDETYKLAKIK